MTRPLVAVFAGTHGVAQAIGGSDPTQAMVERIAAGGAVVSQVCASGDLGLKVFDLALEVPVADIRTEAALDERGCAATMAFGMEAVAGGTDLIVVSGLGFGGEIGAAALLSALFGEEPERLLGEGAAAEAAAAALAMHAGKLKDPLEALRRLGGRETAAIAGAVLAARTEKVPVVLDGFSALAAAAVLKAANPAALEHCLLGQVGTGAERRAAELLGLTPLLDLGIASGDGTGGALAAGVVKAAAQASVGAMAAA